MHIFGPFNMSWFEWEMSHMGSKNWYPSGHTILESRGPLVVGT